MRLAMVLAIFWAGGAWAQDWSVQSGAQIEALLSGQRLVYQNATQEFYASGRTMYDAGRESWGSWRVQGDKYCSQWPPSEQWTCYGISLSGNTVRFRRQWPGR